MTQDPDRDLETTRAASLSDDPTLVAGRYRVLRTLGRGGGGIVWLARDENLGREVALKKVSGEADKDVLLTRGMREARTSAALAHDNVVRVYDAFEHDGVPWIVMEYVPGPSLAELIEGGKALPVEKVARIGAQVATALAAAHGAGVLHRDVKPANVLLTDETGTDAKLTDFGIARGDEDHALTRTGMVSGTAAYFSPEIAQGDDPSRASDVWALGATLYTAVEGRRPFPDAPNAVAQLHTIVREAPREPRLAGPLTPVLAGMLHGDPQLRWSAEQAAEALTEVARGAAAPLTEEVWRDTSPTPHGAGAGLAAAGTPAWIAGATQEQRPVDSTRQVPTSGAPTRSTPPARESAYVRETRTPAPQRPGPRWGVIAGWVLSVPLAVLLGWLIWTIATSGDGGLGGDDASSSTTSVSEPAATGTVDPVEAGQLARTFYETLLQGVGPASAYLGPDATVDPGIADGLTRVEWENVTTTPAADGSVAVGITVRYFYGRTVYEQREDLVVAHTDGSEQPLIVSRSTSEPTVTGPGGSDGSGSTEGSGPGSNG